MTEKGSNINAPPPPYPGPPGFTNQPPPNAPPAGGYYAPPPAGAYVQPPAGYAPGTTTTVVITAPGYWGPQPVSMQCPQCSAQIVTETTPQAGTLAWLICILLAVFGCWLGCCLIPFCIDDCQDIEHRCPNCKRFLGVHKRM